MNEEEIKRFIESRGYQFLTIKHLRNGFRVRYQSRNFRYSQTFRKPLNEFPSQNNGSELWLEFSKSFPKIKGDD